MKLVAGVARECKTVHGNELRNEHLYANSCKAAKSINKPSI